MNSNYYKIVLKILNIGYGKNLFLKGCPIIFSKKKSTISLGNNVTIKSSFLSNLIGLYSRTVIVTRKPGAKIIIGNNVGISGSTIYARQFISIGDNTIIGGNVKILDNDFHPIEADGRVNQFLKNSKEDVTYFINSKPIIIGRNCFIGCNSILLKGTELGDGCVVGAGSVVSGKYSDFSVIAGNPAKLIKKTK